MESGLDKLSDIFESCNETKGKIPKEIMDKYMKAPLEHPL